MSNTAFAEFAPPIANQSDLRRAITAACRRTEVECLAPLLEIATFPECDADAVRDTARALVTAIRTKSRRSGIEGLVQEYSLSSQEGVALMCLAEALLRIPDKQTRDALIRDKISDGDWKSHISAEHSLFVNAASWSLVVTGKLLETNGNRGLAKALSGLVARAGEPVIRRGVDIAMRMMGEQFVMGESIDEALKRSLSQETKGFHYSYDMLGEAAITSADAARYYTDYEAAIHAIGKAAAGRGVYDRPGISIKLSALHPRYSRAQASRVMNELLPCAKALAVLAKKYEIGFNIDAEEADRLELSLDLVEHLALDPDLAGWNGLGFVVQAYSKRCPFVIDWLINLADRANRRVMVRLVKGAYWDAEIKRAQVDGLSDFPVYTRKLHTDAAYIACAKKLLAARHKVFPQFATHNAQTLATIHQMAGPDFAVGDWEFQCLYGMGETLYEEVIGPTKLARPCRVYAPVGSHDTLLAYLVRRLLENGANSSFVHRIGDPAVTIDELVADPVELIRACAAPGEKHESIDLPADIYGERRNSLGIDLTDEAALGALSQALIASAKTHWKAQPAVQGLQIAREPHALSNPANRDDIVGQASFALEHEAVLAACNAAEAAAGWAATAVERRAAILERAADALQARMPTLLGLIVREAGKSIPNAIAEVREAIDFLRYYAGQARLQLGADILPLGPVVCISPWNFPLAIFTGQIAAALVAGNPVIAKPAEETPLIAAEAIRILHEAGVPLAALQFVPGDGSIGATLVAAPEIAGVIFTGSTEVARRIQAQLSTRLSPQGRPIPFIAETGGQNAMMVDSSALAEQVVADVMTSAFDSAGQRCSALRLLCLQEEIADRTLTMLKGALKEVRIGSTDRLEVDIGPVITAEAKANIEQHIALMRSLGCKITRLALPMEAESGNFVSPTIIELDTIDDLKREIFGPVLHVIRYRRQDLDTMIDAINATGYGLTFGLHTRIDETIAHVTARVTAGNIYINRNVIGAVVGGQPFGGVGLSGTGPKAGGPLYLKRLVSNPRAFQADMNPQLDTALSDLAHWLRERGEHDAERIVRLIGKASPIGLRKALPGPVGETNIYTLRRRGTILLRPSTRIGLLHQIAVAISTGNEFVVEADQITSSLVDELPESVRHRYRCQGDSITNILVEGGAEKVMTALAEFANYPGRIVLVQASEPESMLEPAAYHTEWLVEEVSISTNTAAAGGNATLIMLS